MKMAAEGNMDRIKKLADSGYMNLNVSRPSGKTAAMVAKKEGHKEVALFLEHAPEFFKNVNSMHRFVFDVTCVGRLVGPMGHLVLCVSTSTVTKSSSILVVVFDLISNEQ